MRTVRFDRGTLVAEGFGDEPPDGFVRDPRVSGHRGPASAYPRVVLDLHRAKVPYTDDARRYGVLGRPHASPREPRPYQREAIEAWRRAGRRGTVVLPTGAGKSFVAELAIADADRDVLVVAPTLDLVSQWYDGLIRAFGEPVGVLGGGVHEVHPITVATYDSAWMHIERYGDRFGLIVYDEVHHLPGASYRFAADGAIAPFRLGLTATLERPDNLHHDLDHLVGPVVYARGIVELSGEFLAEYSTEVISVALEPAERAAYEEARSVYRTFVDDTGLRLGGPDGWRRFLQASARSTAGRKAFRAWRESRRILEGTEAKMKVVASLLREHHDNRVLVFTNDNATVFEVSRRLLVPAITHHTDVKERRAILAAFADGSLPAIATSRVLNEGVDLPSADVAIIMSGTATTREHVQRLGRVLRKRGDKQARLYELVVGGSVEEQTSARRRDHDAYRSRG